MLRINNLPLPLNYQDSDLIGVAARKLRVPDSAVKKAVIVRKSVDARDKGDVHFVVSLDVAVDNEKQVLKKLKPGTAELIVPDTRKDWLRADFKQRPLVVGAGPAGLFAALTLAKKGARPILIERGKPVDQRTNDVDRMQKKAILDPESNVQFGEGGAGAFSDGKLTTGIKNPNVRTVLETFVEHGAPEEILILQKPHIGTDKLKGVVASIRNQIIALGGEVRFNTKLTSLLVQDGQVVGARVVFPHGDEEIMTRTVLLCIGHSARDTVQTLFNQGVIMVQKPFAMGVRIEHLQSMVNRSQYGKFANHPALKAADYKLAVHTPDERGCYTFCMCPGGEVIAAASEPGRLAVNGMSYHARAGVNANAALLVGVRTEDFGSDHPLAGFALQRSIEEAAFLAGGSNFNAPVQRVEDFLADRASTRLGDVTPTYKPGVTPADLRACLPDFIIQDLKLGIRGMDNQLRGFAHPDAVLTGVETRSSSPVRMVREKLGGQAENLNGLYPVGEGAGYAGGIVSAAADGINAAESAIQRSHFI